MKLSFPFALQILDTAAGARRQGSATSALARGLDRGRRRSVRSHEQGEGDNQGSGIGHDASIRGMAETQNPLHFPS